MPHLRKRHAIELLKKLGKFWPVIGILGLRQSGKSTLLRGLSGVDHIHTLDDEDTLEDVRASAKNFLHKVTHVGACVAIDEAQKAPSLFDAIKLIVDRKRKPGSFFLTGSSEFSAKLGIRESLTGRIGFLHLHPFTLAEAHQLPLDPTANAAWHRRPPRIQVELALAQLPLGGLPVPLFTRDHYQRSHYYQNWLETSVLRDVARLHGRGFDPDVAWSLLRQLGNALREGELPTLAHFKQGSRVVRRYFESLEGVFILRKIPCHEVGVGKEAWLPTDTGLAREFMGTEVGEGASLSLGRVFVLNEILANAEYCAARIKPLYYKTARGAPVDLVWGDTLVKVSLLPSRRLAYDERPLAAALVKMKLNRGLLVVPRNEVQLRTRGISIVPWTYWS